MSQYNARARKLARQAAALGRLLKTNRLQDGVVITRLKYRIEMGDPRAELPSHYAQMMLSSRHMPSSKGDC